MSGQRSALNCARAVKKAQACLRRGAARRVQIFLRFSAAPAQPLNTMYPGVN
jgi:hypothetical protein